MLHTVLLLGTVFCVKIRLNYNVSIEYRVSNKIQVSIGFEQNSGIDPDRTKPGIEPALLLTLGYLRTVLIVGSSIISSSFLSLLV